MSKQAIRCPSCGLLVALPRSLTLGNLKMVATPKHTPEQTADGLAQDFALFQGETCEGSGQFGFVESIPPQADFQPHDVFA